MEAGVAASALLRSPIKPANHTRESVLLVWQKGQIIPGADPNVLRKDRWGAYIRRDKYGDTTPNGYGWEIDHDMPVARGGSDDLANLQPLR
jgi:hypothetical protein